MFVSDIIDQVIEILGRCDRQKALQRIADAVIALQDEGNWNANVGVLDIATSNGANVVTLPREVETPLAVAINGVPAFMRDEFFRFHLNGDGLTDGNTVPWAWDDQGIVPVLSDIKVPGPLIARCDLAADLNVIIRVLGFSTNGKRLRQQLRDGSWIDGIEVKAAFVAGAPTSAPPDEEFQRIITVSPSTVLSLTAHGLDTGAQMFVSGSLPAPLVNGAPYFLQVLDNNRLVLHTSRIAALTGQAPIKFSSFGVSPSVVLTETRRVQVRTRFYTPTANFLTLGAKVLFAGTTLADPLVALTEYFAAPVDATSFLAYDSLDAAKTQSAPPITVTTPGASMQAHALREISPVTQLLFSLPHNFVTGDQVTAENSGGELPSPLIAGTPYFVRSLSSMSLSLHVSASDASSNVNPISLTTPGIGTSALAKIIKASVAGGGSSVVTTATAHNLSLPSGSGATATAATPVNQSITSIAVSTSVSNSSTTVRSVISALVGGINEVFLFSSPHNFLTGDQVTAENTGGVLPAPLVSGQPYYVRSISATLLTLHTSAIGASNNGFPIATFTPGTGINALVKIVAASVAGGGSNYFTPPKVVISGGGGSGATAEAIVSGGIVTSVRVITGGTGYTSAPTVSFVAQGGSYVWFKTNGTLPTPVKADTIYRAEAPMTSNTFSLNDTIPATVGIQSGGSGELFLVISRTFSIGFLPSWKVDATNVTTGQAAKIFTKGLMPVTAPTQLDNFATAVYLRKLSDSAVELYDSNANAIAAPATTGRISAISSNLAQIYLAFQNTVTAIPHDGLLQAAYTAFLRDMVTAEFTTTGTLPAPLSTGTPYQLMISGNSVQVYSGGSPLVITSVGTGVHRMSIVRTMGVSLPNTLDVADHGFLLGEEVIFGTDNTLPAPLTTNSPYYARPITDDIIEIYDTPVQAEDVPATTGCVEFVDEGVGESYAVVQRAFPPVALIEQVEKPQTRGHIRLYAWDTGHTPTNVVLLGEYHPTETLPSYRQIKIAASATAVRMKYRRRPLSALTERDFINLDSKMAVLMMVQSQELLFRKFLDEAEKYRIIAVEHLNKRNRALDGPRAPTIQINADITTAPDDMMV
jgi:hypothetical protein